MVPRVHTTSGLGAPSTSHAKRASLFSIIVKLDGFLIISGGLPEKSQVHFNLLTNLKSKIGYIYLRVDLTYL